MSRQGCVWAGVLAAVSALVAPSASRAGMLTQNASMPLTTTNFGSGNSVAGSPLVFQQFDNHDGALTLDSVNLSFHALIKNDFKFQFTTPSTLTETVATGDPTTPGPTITLYQPDGKTSLLTVNSPSDPSFLTRSVTYGYNPGESTKQNFGSDLAPTSPFYLAPAVSQASNSLKLTNPADLALFTGSGSIGLPVSAAAYSHFSSNSGNGYGGVTTEGSADVTVTYQYHSTIPAPQTVPEPAALVLWALGGLGLSAAHRARRRA